MLRNKSNALVLVFSHTMITPILIT